MQTNQTVVHPKYLISSTLVETGKKQVGRTVYPFPRATGRDTKATVVVLENLIKAWTSQKAGAWWCQAPVVMHGMVTEYGIKHSSLKPLK